MIYQFPVPVLILNLQRDHGPESEWSGNYTGETIELKINGRSYVIGEKGCVGEPRKFEDGMIEILQNMPVVVRAGVDLEVPDMDKNIIFACKVAFTRTK